MKLTTLMVMSGAALVAAPSLCLAQQELADGLGFSVFRAFLALIFVLALFFLFVYAIRRWYPRALQRFPGSPVQPGESIELVSVKALDPKRALYVVRAHGKHYLLGATDQSVNKLDEWVVSPPNGEGSHSGQESRADHPAG